MKTLEEIKKMDPSKLLAELKSAKEKLFKHKFEVNTGQSKNIHEIKKYKKHVARIKTLLKNKQSNPEINED